FKKPEKSLFYYELPMDSQPLRLAIDKKKNLWITLNSSKKKVELLNTTVDSYPYELYIDSKGRAWITKPLNSSVALYEYKKVGKAFQLTKSAEYTFNGTPAAIALDRKCTGLWVVFNDTDQIALTDLKTGTTVYNDTFSWSSTPIEVAVDKKGYVWYAEKTSHRLVKLTKQLKKTELWLHEAIYLPLEPIQLFMDAKNGIWLLSPQGGVAYLSEKLPFKIT
ncbi:MAG: hypothetical protein J7L98_02415, partial [Candidatus Verstraetearchaeota archaeon]|nr:hypothetical protein [Candidatus Verstraetearchaeota archaeon]